MRLTLQVASPSHLQQNHPTSMSRNDVPHPLAAADPPSPRRHYKKWLLSILRWGIAVVGIWYVLSNISLTDRVTYLSPTSQPVTARLAEPAPEEYHRSTIFMVRDPDTGQVVEKTRKDLVNPPDQKSVVLREGNRKVDVLALDLTEQGKDAQVKRVLIREPATKEIRWIKPWEVAGGYQLKVPYPAVDRGIAPMVRRADKLLLLSAVFCFPTVFLLTALRWDRLLRALDIHMPFRLAFKLNMVGAFYNTFMPGSTGGDILKAYYASKLTTHRTRAVMSVLIDRVLGLLALVILGGSMAGYQYFVLPIDDPARRKCAQIAIGSFAIIMATSIGMLIFYSRDLLRLTPLIRRLPAQRQINHAIETLEIYRRRPGLILWAIAITLPVHATVVLSAMLAGLSFGILRDHPLYYWAVVPVVVLAGAIPISPQGAGVMEFFAIMLTKRQGCTITQAFVLTMSIRLVQMLWNLVGGIFVFQGGFHAPTETEKHELEEDTPDTPPATVV